MKREDKHAIIQKLTTEINEAQHFYIADTGELNAGDTSALRRICFKEDIKLLVVKNTLLKKALEQANGNYEELYSVLSGPTALMICDTGNKAAKLIKQFRKVHKKPILKGAFVEQSIYLGDDQLDVLVVLKSKEELVGDIIALLQSPIQNVISSLNSGKYIIAGVVKTLADRES